MTISAKVIADSVSPESIRLTTMQLKYPKFIHGEAKTHRVMRIGDAAFESLEEVGFMDFPGFSRNASSSRAIPVTRLIKDVMDDPVIPIVWRKNQPGMSGGEMHEERVRTFAFGPPDGGLEAPGGMSWTNEDAWLFARDNAVKMALAFHEAGYAKETVNRLIEPWCHINVVVSATDYANFFALRRHEAAQPEMRALADAMFAAREASVPRPRKPGEWHLPYVDEDDLHAAYWSTRYAGRDNAECFDEAEALDACRKVSVARCARVSYLTQEGRHSNLDEDLALYDRLVGSAPPHASPAEHQATPDGTVEGICVTDGGWQNPHLHGNFVGWIQYRKTLPNECVADR